MILALEAASNDLSIAIWSADGVVAQDAWTSAHRQSAEILPRLQALLERAGTDLAAATAVAVGIGPGSFTGLRVALALAKGICAARRIPLVGVPSLHAWLAAHADADMAIARAGSRDAYLLTRGDHEARIVDRDDLVALVADARVVAPTDLAGAFALDGSEPPRAAAAVARLAAERLRADPAGDDVRTLEPLYLRAPRGVPAQTQGDVRWL